MKEKMLCDRCRKQFEGEPWLLEKKECLCPECFKETQEEI